MTLRQAVAAHLRAERLRARLTQAALAARLGARQEYVAQLERGAGVTLESADRVLRALGATGPWALPTVAGARVVPLRRCEIARVCDPENV